MVVTYMSCLEREDVVRVHDGADKRSPVIAALCNTAAQLEVLSTGPDFLVRFVADSERPGQGFRAAFEFQAANVGLRLSSHPPEHNVSFELNYKL
ncbi:hypothetical protein B566_EDAN006677 [Ephemera danica]|nr:hypothetical protein B566_EDAN006677 [Ephemera danica]